MNPSATLPRFNFFSMFWEGMKQMTVGKTLWMLVIIKLIIMFAILKPIFSPDFLNSRFKAPTEKANYVREQLIDAAKR